MRLLVTKSDTIEVTVYCWENAENAVEASNLKEDVPQDIEVCEKVLFTFRKPGYQDSNVIIRNSSLRPGTGTEDNATLNVQAFQEQILRTLLIEWDMKDDDDKHIPMNNISVNNLMPSVARAAVTGVLDKITL